MAVWNGIFFPLLLLRPLLTLAIGLADLGSLDALRGLQLVLGCLLLITVAYTGWSVKHYFGIARALGGDHFRQEYRQLSRVKQGAFQYNANAMYAFAFSLFWALALLTGSQVALATALFQHAYIWIHMYCTEELDMQVIYDQRAL